MNPASVMKLVTTFAALELLGRDYRWRTDAYLDGPLVDGTLKGNLVLKGRGDPKITIEQWQSLMRDAARARPGAHRRRPRARSQRVPACPSHDAAAFDNEPLRPYNVGPDAMLVNFKAVRFAFSPNASDDGVDVKVEPPLPQLALGAAPVARRRPLRRLAAAGRGRLHQPVACRRGDVSGQLRALLRRSRLARRAARPSDLRARHVPRVLRRGGRRFRRRGARRARAAARAVRRARIAAALRRRARRQQAFEQRHGAAAFPHAGDDGRAAAGDAGQGRRGRAALAREAQAGDARVHDRERIGAVAVRTGNGRRAGPPARGGGRERGARRVRDVACGRGDRRYARAADDARARRRTRTAQDRLARRRPRARRLCHRCRTERAGSSSRS